MLWLKSRQYSSCSRSKPSGFSISSLVIPCRDYLLAINELQRLFWYKVCPIETLRRRSRIRCLQCLLTSFHSALTSLRRGCVSYVLFVLFWRLSAMLPCNRCRQNDYKGGLKEVDFNAGRQLSLTPLLAVFIHKNWLAIYLQGRAFTEGLSKGRRVVLAPQGRWHGSCIDFSCLALRVGESSLSYTVM